MIELHDDACAKLVALGKAVETLLIEHPHNDEPHSMKLQDDLREAWEDPIVATVIAEMAQQPAPDNKNPYGDFKHCDDYINSPEVPEIVRRWVFLQRLPATERILMAKEVEATKLYAKYEGKKVRLTMASRFGDVGITDNLNRENGYDRRVPLEHLTDFEA